MHVSSLAVRRPIATTMLLAAAVLLGLVSWPRLELALLPDVEASSLGVWIPYPEASVLEIEEAVARPVEEVLYSTPGVRGVHTRVVSEGVSFTIELHAGTDPDLAALAVRERLDSVRWNLPQGAGTPRLIGGAGNEDPMLVLALASSDLPAAADWAKTVLRPRLEQLDGLARAYVTGAPEPEIRVVPDLERMEAAGLSVTDLGESIAAANLELPGGVLRQRGIRYSVRVDSRLKTAKEVGDVLVGSAATPIRVRDVARVEDGFGDPRGWARLDGSPAVGILLFRESGENLLRVAERVHEELDRLRADHPELDLAVVADTTPFVRQSIGGVWQAVWLGGALVFGVLSYFLRDHRSPLFLITALPISVIVTFALLDLLGVSLNLMSLGGIALGVGMLVDNGIVCLENIHRLRMAGLSAREAASRGAREISLPVLASTLTTCAVFVPLAWVPGRVGELFRDQAIAVGVALLVSLVLALTLLPMLAARFPGRSPVAARRPGYSLYHGLFEHCRRSPGWFGIAVVVAVLGSLVLLARLPREILPEMATDHLELLLRLPAGTDVARTDEVVASVEAWLEGREEVASLFASIGAAGAIDPSNDEQRRGNRARLRAVLTPRGVTRRAELVEAFRAEFREAVWSWESAPGGTEIASVVQGGRSTLTCQVTGPDAALAEELAHELAGGLPGWSVVAAEREPRVRVTPREETLWRYGIDEREAFAAIEAATSGYEVTRIRRFDEEHPVVVRFEESGDPAAATLFAEGRSFPVRELFDVATELAPSTLHREGQARVASLNWDGPLRGVGGAIESLRRAIENVALPPGYTIAIGGSYREMRETLAGILRAFLLSAGLVVLVLAAQFESLKLPIVVFAAVPLAFVGVAVVLVLTGGTVNVLSGIGVVVLVGIVVNDSILKVDLLGRLRREGMPRHEAMVTAGRRRYRPIVMTTLTTALALAPLFFGRGAELRAPMASTLIGGLLSSTALTLLVIPLLFDRLVGEMRSSKETAEVGPPTGVPAKEAAT